MGVWTVIAGLLISWAGDAYPVEGVRRIPIPEEETGYSHSYSQVIDSKDRLDAFLGVVKKEEAWNKRDQFNEAIAGAKRDFSKEALVLIRHTVGSGSIRVRFRLTEGKDRTLTATITHKTPELLNLEIKYYCYAFAVRRDRAERIEVLQKVEVLDIPRK